MNSAGSPRAVLAEGELSAPYAPVEGSEGDRRTDRATPKTADGSMHCLWLPLVLSVRGGEATLDFIVPDLVSLTGGRERELISNRYTLSPPQ